MSVNRERELPVSLESIPYKAKLERSLSSQAGYKTYLITKRAIDIVGASAGLLILLPFFLLISLTYLAGEGKGMIFFKQKRVGSHGKIFYIFKFRSMVSNAEEVLKKNKELYAKYIKNNYKLEQEEDPRITKVGKFLRKTSLDELPQLINVLKGEMSLVGPRPIVVEELKEYGDKSSEFLSVSPGLTGYWQISGRSNIGYPERVEIELYYVYHQSLKLDIIILLKSILHVLLRKGAY